MHTSKLTTEDRVLIRRLWARRAHGHEIAKHFGVSKGTIGYIVREGDKVLRDVPAIGRGEGMRLASFLKREDFPLVDKMLNAGADIGTISYTLNLKSNSSVRRYVKGLYPYDAQTKMTIEEHIADIARQDAEDVSKMQTYAVLFPNKMTEGHSSGRGPEDPSADETDKLKALVEDFATKVVEWVFSERLKK